MEALLVKKMMNINNPSLGFVTGLVVKSNGGWILADSDTLPTQGDIFVYGNYETEIEEKFDDGVILFASLEEALDENASCKFSVRSSGIGTPARDLGIALVFNVAGSISPQRNLEISSPLKPAGLAYFAAVNDSGSQDIFGPFEVADSIFDTASNLWRSNFRVPADSVLTAYGLDANSIYRTDRDTIPSGHIFSLDRFQTDQGSIALSIGLGEALRVISASSELFLDNRSLLSLMERTLNPTSKLGRKGRRELLAQLDASSALKEVIKDRIRLVFSEHSEVRKNLIDGLLDTGEIDQDQVQVTPGNLEATASTEELQTAKNTISELTNQVQEITLYWQREEEKNQSLTAQLSELQSDVVAKRENQLNDKIRELTEMVDLDANYERRRWELEAVEKQLTDKQEEIDKLDEVKASLNRQILQDDRVFRDKALEVIPFLNVIGSSLDTNEEKAIQYSQDVDEYKVCDQTFLDVIAQRILEQGYKASKEFLVCFVAAAFSSRFVGIFGLPGTGKTTLARCFANALGSVENSSTFVNVGKGWTSHTDFIGYANTFIDKFKYQDNFFRQFGDKHPKDTLLPPRTAILDEASLSSVDSYLSDFMSVGNGFQTLDLDTINLSGKQFWFQPDFRFILTFNFDENTESLPRKFLDRMPLINCEDYDFEGQIELDFDRDFQPFSAKSLNEFLHLTHTTGNQKASELIQRMEAFLEPWEPLGIIRKRRRMQIEQFLKLVANMDGLEDNFVRKFIAFTFLLPSIDGTGDKFANLLKEAANEVGNFEVREEIGSILAEGERFQRYRYL